MRWSAAFLLIVGRCGVHSGSAVRFSLVVKMLGWLFLAPLLQSVAIGGLWLVGGTSIAVSQEYRIPVAPNELPSTAQTTYLGWDTADVIYDIPGEETTVRYYRHQDRTVVAELIITNQSGVERIYGWMVDEDGEFPFEYTVFDADGEGRYVRIPQGDFTFDNTWLSNFYYKAE